MNHTKEPWHVKKNPEWGNADYRISNKEDDEWANFGQIAYASEYNAKRIVACVNACAGMGDPVEEITELKRQLRWRPASDLPEKAGMYLVEAKPYTGWDSTIITTAYFNGERFPWHDVVRWLPIPPAP